MNQGISVETMQVNWSAVSGAIAYEAQWRRNDGNWINVPRSSTTSFEVSGIYAGRYLVRVRAINAAEISSGWAYSEEKTLTGKVGEPLAPLALATRSLVHGVQVSWEFPTGSGDTLRTELQYSKNQDGSAPMPLSDVAYPGKSYQQMGLSMGAEFWYRARLVDRLGNESPWTGWVQGMASDNFDDYYENLTDAIKDTDAWEETQRTISETQEGIRNTQQELEQTAEELRQEAADQAKQVSQDIDASAKSITADVDGKISAVNKTITDELTSVNESLDSGLAQANKGIQEAKSAVADANQQIAILSKSLADGDAALNAQIKTAENGLKQSLSQVNTTLTNAVKQETADRIADVNAKAAQAADELLAATQGIEASIESLTQVMKSADENLAREMSSLAAGANIQFDSQVIWHFNNQTTEGWTGSAGVPGVSQDGWLRPADSATDPYITSPGGLAVDGAAYRFIMLRFRKTGKPVWAGEIRWVSAGENFNNTKRYIVAEPEYADGVATLTVRDIPWTGNIDRIRLDLTNQQDASNFIEFDWIAVGRPAPGASTAALQDVRSTLSNALTAEAQARSTLAAQMRGSYEGSDLEKVTSGLLYQEKTARVTAISAEVKARESLQTQFNDNKAAVSGELSSLTTEQSAQASRIGGLETSLGKKADATALTSLTQKVEQQGATLTSQGAALTSLTNRMGQTETGLAGTNEALSGLESTVTQQGDRITSQGQSITKLTSDLGTTNAALAKKAEASTVTALTQQVEQNGQDIRSNTDSITSLSNQLVNGQPNSWSRRIYPVQLANAGTVPSFSDIRAVAPVVVDEVADAAKLDFTSAGSYLIALYSCQVKVAADTTITMAPGNRVFDDTGAVFVNGVQVAWGNASWTTVSFDLKAGWNTVEFLVNQWTGQAYINLGLKLSDKVAEMYSGLGVSALANAAGVLSSNVSQIGNDVVSNSQSITQLRNALTQTDANVASKADQTAMNSLTGRVEKTESGLTAANANITSLKSAVRAGNASGGDLIPNPTFDPTYDQMGFSVVSTTAEDVPSGCPYGYAARIASRDHHPNFAAFPATLNDVIEISALVACGAGTANFNLYVGTAVRPDTSTGAPLMAGGGKSPSATWQRTTWRFKVTQAMVDRGYIRPFLQISQNSPYGTVWFVTDWHMRNVTAAQKVQDTADATAAAVDSLTTTVTQQGNLLTSTGNRTTQLENGLATTNAAVAKKADATAVQNLTNTVTQLGNDLTAANSAITKLTGNLANTDKALAQKADATALATLDTKVTQQGKTLESQSNSLTNLSNSLSQVAADIDASGQIPGNLVVNPSFERGLDGYIGQSAAASVVETSTPHGGTRALKVDAGNVSPGQYVSFVQGRTYEIGVWVKDLGATTDNGAGNNKLRIGNSAGQPVFERPYNSGTIGSDWTLISGRWKATETAKLPVTLSNGLTAGSRCFDDFYVIDVTDSVKIDANASALSSLQNTVTQQGKDIASQSTSITDLKNNLDTTNANVAKKADAAALQTLQNTVTQQGKDIASASSSITSLQNNLSTTNANVAKKADATALNALQNTVTQQGSSISSQGNSITQLKNDVDSLYIGASNLLRNSDKSGAPALCLSPTSGFTSYELKAITGLVGKNIAVKTQYTMTLWFKEYADGFGTTKPFTSAVIGRSAVGTDSWSLRYYSQNGIVTRDGDLYKWVGTITAESGSTLFVGVAGLRFLFEDKSQKTGCQIYQVKLEEGNKGTSWSPASEDLSDAISGNSQALSSLDSRVTKAEGSITSQGNSITQLQNELTATNANVSKKADASALASLQNTVTQQGKDITSVSSDISLLKNSLATTDANVAKKADSSALSSLQSTVNQQGTSISSIGNRTTSLENGLSTAQNNIARKADASALQDLRNTVTSQGGDLTAANSSITSLQASMNRRTVFTVTARGFGNSVTPGVFDESGKNLFTPGRSWALVTFAKQSDGSAVIATSKTYDVFGSANNGDTMSADIGALTSGTYVCVLTFDEPSGNRGKILSALESLGGTSEVVNSLPYRGAYILLGRKGMRSGDGLELRAPTGGDATAHISTSVEFVNGIMMGLGAAGGVMMKADANASAITTLQNTVKTQGGNIDSLSSSITALENSLRSTNDTVSKKADTTAVSSLTGRVSQVENTITSQSQSITSLTSSINTISTQGANPWVDGTFESYGDGHVLGGGGTAVVVASQKFTGNKSLQVSRGANDNGNSDKQLGSWQSVREDAKFRFEFWAMMPADQAPSSGWTTLVGIQSQNAAGQNAWQAAVTVSEASLGARDKWVKFTGIASNNGAGRTRAVVWISTRGATGNGTPGYSLYIDDLVITDVTDAKAAQDASDATASAVSGLTARVTDAEGKITAQAQQQTALASKVDNANSRVDNMAKTLSDSQSTQASLNTSLQSQIDAQAAANIKNQTTLDNTIKSVASITSTQQTHATALEALATQQTTLTSSVGDLSASVQNTAKTVADVNGTVSSLWSMKVETVNGKNVGAGITLGSNGETSDMILYADRFSLFNRNNATAVPVMVAEGNELYIDTARIKNSSLTSTKIADGSITNAKIGHEIRSNDFVDGSRGWRIAKDGSSQFNNVIVRGAVYATDGWFQGTVYANHIEGDIGSFAINIAQHRTRKVPKATWQWFELARFRRQNFDQVINIRGGLLQTDSITIDGGAKLRAGMSYAPGADGGLNPGYLSYAMLLRGTGATSGGGSMELGIELMYETGGATRLLTAQGEMNVDNMSFVVPAGSGDAVLRYGCYLDRNGQMVLTILSRFDAFAARNNNVIRGSST
ncbi:DUF1983 domain-containing protein [Klebsiella pneumoniae]|uniref:phage tail tip fiber protein n=1 Tax=Klebsiella pneumoniae TaxID=573 RepID=UPI0028F88059|nr:DUF1983 domain-containing protein [Klebsiella pneumoniae]MDT9909312.1 DUF1983 domain-containing protein [Klebsiella pneumoniae]